jgi:hypothetical protein
MLVSVLKIRFRGSDGAGARLVARSMAASRDEVAGGR